ncbi:hypothetical protein [Rhodosalinus sp. 5P4]|uniref:hypothetical protein n=1 Tax=Rhodosalinus sp. 5P4 TaxID=3239196 RepID=UPI003524050D
MATSTTASVTIAAAVATAMPGTTVIGSALATIAVTLRARLRLVAPHFALACTGLLRLIGVVLLGENRVVRAGPGVVVCRIHGGRRNHRCNEGGACQKSVSHTCLLSCFWVA